MIVIAKIPFLAIISPILKKEEDYVICTLAKEPPPHNVSVITTNNSKSFDQLS